MTHFILNYEKALAAASFLAAVAFAFASLWLNNNHEPAAGNCAIVAQFLILTASIIGVDYKLKTYGSTTPRNPQQQSA